MLWNGRVVPISEQPLVPISDDLILDVWTGLREWIPSVTDYFDSG